jgi:formylglycine-generating enzyme required for sulfatase activity
MSTKSSSSPAAAEGAGTGQPVPARRAARNRAQHQLRNMAWIPGATFAMGSAGFYPEERPVHRVSVDGFWMDTRPVTVEDFRRFVKANGYVTVAERPLDPGEYPGADPGLLVPGSLVFHRTAGPVDLRDHSNWWAYVPGASRRHPAGPGSDCRGRERHPVTQVAYQDAESYAGVRRQGTAHRGGVGIRGARRPRRCGVCVGR